MHSKDSPATRAGVEDAYAQAVTAQRYEAALDIARREAKAGTAGHRGLWLRRVGASAAMVRRDAEACDAYEAARGLGPLSASDFYNLGLCSDRLGRIDQAVSHYRAAIALDGNDPRPLNNLGKTLNRVGDLAEAESCLRRALELEPGRPSSELNLAVNLLLRGDWTAGWRYFEARLRVFDVAPPMPFPRWDGRHRKDRLLLLRGEQGLGDLIQFSRFASLLGRAGQPVIVQADPRMVRLLKSLPNVLDVISTAQVLNSDRHPIEWSPLLSVPGQLGVTPATIPWTGPYLTAEPARVANWRQWLPTGGLRIGIAWQGNPDGEIDRGRSFPLAAYTPIAALPGVTLVALQKGAALDQVRSVPFGDAIRIPGADFDSGPDAFLDSAALTASLDLVISSDTAIAHLAGALNRPTFLALQRWPDWRWLLDRPDTPWYPNMQLFRQSAAGEWTDVFDRMAASLRARFPQ